MLFMARRQTDDARRACRPIDWRTAASEMAGGWGRWDQRYLIGRCLSAVPGGDPLPPELSLLACFWPPQLWTPIVFPHTVN